MLTLTLHRDLALALLARAEDEAASPVYGFFTGGDPRDFTPDPEGSTDEERAAHKAACEARDADDTVPFLPGTESTTTAGDVYTHRTRAGFGLGTQIYRDPLMAALAAALRKAAEVAPC